MLTAKQLVEQNEAFVPISYFLSKFQIERASFLRCCKFLHIDLQNVKRNQSQTQHVVSSVDVKRLENFLSQSPQQRRATLRKATCKEKYGTDDVTQTECFKQKKKQSMQEKYGVDCYSQTEKFKQGKDQRLKKRKATCKEKYGVEHPTQNSSVKQRTKQTCQQRYGADFYLQSQDRKQIEDTSRLKAKQTCLDKYGVPYASQADCVRQKSKQTCLSRYGVEHQFLSKQIQDKKTQTMLNKYGTANSMQSAALKEKRQKTLLDKENQICQQYDCNSLRELRNSFSLQTNVIQHILIAYFGFTEDDFIHVPSADCIFYKKGKVIDMDLFAQKVQLLRSMPQSAEEKEFVGWLKSLPELQDTVIKENDRTLIAPKEIDVFVPSKNVAIEFNGLRWHSEVCIDSRDLDACTYHLWKTERCEEQGVRLIHIFEDEWLDKTKRDIIKSIVCSALGIYQCRIPARKCLYKQITKEQAKLFLTQNHINGFIAQSHYYAGLFYQDQLVQVITIGKSRFNKQEIELHRMATLKNTQIVGGFSKLLKHAMEDLGISELFSYADRRMYNALGYKNCGFIVVSCSKPSYFYVNKGHRENRLRYQKHKLIKLFGRDFCEGKTEKEICAEKGLYRIYDCGAIKLKLERKLKC